MPTTDPPDLETELYAKIHGALDNYDPWAGEVDEANRIWLDATDSNQDPDKSNKSDHDYPEAKLIVVSGASQMFASGDQTFGTRTGPCLDWVEKQSHSFRLTVTSIGQTEKEASNLRRLTVNALRLAGPTLGHEDVITWSLKWTLDWRDQGETDRQRRCVITVDITVNTESEGRHMTGEI